ncbi:MAG: excinuclease ABC subunit UvrC [Bacillota bacterium]
MSLEDKLNYLPPKPGVYLFKDETGDIIYVGKAISLKSRVRSYFQAAGALSPKVRAMMARAADLDYIVTDSEVEALILESNLIKAHRPRYNVFLKDDKSYPYIKITLGETFPRVMMTRRVVKDGSRYFGPYTRAGAVHETLRLLRKIFPVRTCKQKEPPVRSRPCLNQHIGRCPGPCCGLADAETYRRMAQEICLFMEGRQDKVIKSLRTRMEEAAERLEFERAAELRDQLLAVEEVMAKQKIISAGLEDRDVIAMARGRGGSCVMVFFVRGGKLLGREHLMLEGTDGMSRPEVLTGFVKQYYHQAEFVPREILLEASVPEEIAVIEQWLREKRGGPVKVAVPRRGEKKQLVEMAGKNALLVLQEEEVSRAARLDRGARDLEVLAAELGLPEIPARLECFDISNIQGAEAVASMVVFEAGRPRPDQYRRFKIRTVTGPDDFASMREVIGRRFRRGREERELIATGRLSTWEAGFHQLPDLVLVDGGKGQLAAACEAMAREGCGHIPVFGLAVVYLALSYINCITLVKRLKESLTLGSPRDNSKG